MFAMLWTELYCMHTISSWIVCRPKCRQIPAIFTWACYPMPTFSELPIRPDSESTDARQIFRLWINRFSRTALESLDCNNLKARFDIVLSRRMQKMVQIAVWIPHTVETIWQKEYFNTCHLPHLRVRYGFKFSQNVLATMVCNSCASFWWNPHSWKIRVYYIVFCTGWTWGPFRWCCIRCRLTLCIWWPSWSCGWYLWYINLRPASAWTSKPFAYAA